MDTKSTNAQSNLPQSDCDQLAELLPAYTLGATDDAETRLVESLLEKCPEYQAELIDYTALSQRMLFAAPPAQTPAALHDKIMAAARGETSASPSLRVIPKPQSRSRLLAGIAVAAAALLIVTNIFWVTRYNDLQSNQGEMLTLLEGQTDILAALRRGNVQRLELASTVEGGEASFATILWSPDFDTAVLFSEDLPALSPDRAYQLWMLGGEDRFSAGVFSVDERGQALLVFQTPRAIDQFDALGITEEPAGGSPAPTTNPIAVGRI
jgi:hypothetical protein